MQLNRFNIPRMHKLQYLFAQIASIVKKNSQILDATGGRFNVFKIIGVTTAETRLHSAFIAELLNVNGSHGLKDKPLKAFINKCLDPDFLFQTENSICNVEFYIGVTTPTSGGRIDIIIRDNENKAIIIENKINAGDQEFQMLRYFNHSKLYKDSRLVYLSLDGKQPSEYSLGGELFSYSTLSYKYDIIDWLTDCKQFAVDFPLVREAVSHYINLLKHLTNSSFMDKSNNEIIDLVMQSPENVQIAFEIENVLTDVKITTQLKFWSQLQKSLEEKGLSVKVDDSKMFNLNKITSYYRDKRNREIRYGLWVEIFNEAGISLHWGCEVQDNIYFGFTIEKNITGGISNNEEFKEYRQIILNCDDLYQTDSPNWLGWMHTTPKLNFREFNSTDIFSLVNEENLKKITNQIADKVVEDKTFILEKLAQLVHNSLSVIS